MADKGKAEDETRWGNISSESLAVAHCFALVLLVILLILGGSYPQSDFGASIRFDSLSAGQLFTASPPMPAERALLTHACSRSR